MSSPVKDDDQAGLAGEAAVRSKDPKSSFDEMDARLEMCFLYAIKFSIKDSELPLLAGTFYKNHMTKYCPAGEHLEIKKSSYKTFSKFLKKQEKTGIINVKTMSKGGGENIVRVDKLHYLLPGRNEFGDIKKTVSTKEDKSSAVTTVVDKTSAITIKDKASAVATVVGQNKLKNVLCITGIAEKETENLKELVIGLARDLKVDMCKTDIDACERRGKPMPGRKREIVVEFASVSVCQDFFTKRGRLRKLEARDGVYINEDLTPYRREVFYHARQYARAKLIKSAFSEDGNVYVMDNSGKKHMIIASEELAIFGVLDPPEPKQKPFKFKI